MSANLGRESEPTNKTSSDRPLALVSVFDKTGVVDFARVLDQTGHEVVSTGGTLKALVEAGVAVTPIEKVMGNPELFDGRIKTLSFPIAAGILYDRHNPEHVAQAAAHGIRPIDVVVCNLYPFGKTAAKPDVTLKEAIEMIDVGGPTMLRAAAKNHRNVLAVPSPDWYKAVSLALLEDNIYDRLRFNLAADTFRLVAEYDRLIAEYLMKQPLASRELLLS